VTWVLASMLILGAALAAGFAWYERTHPSARVIALVATLAALAALGRIAFAATPNVKPTTDIVLISGYVLGGAPGFAVGSVAALASNVFFGQGPWTPWQMTGWGFVGIAGALLGHATGRRLGRVQLAIACGALSYVYGAWMNLSLWVSYSDHSAGALWAYFVTSLWFDVAHVVGSVVFCLAFGPALVRALTRYRTRFEVRWLAVPAAASVLLLAVVAGATPTTAHAADANAAAANASVRYLLDAQNADKGWGGAPGQSSSQLYTGWTALGLAAAGRNPADFGAISYMSAHASQLNDLGELTRTILVLRAAGKPPKLAGRDLEHAVASQQRKNGSFGGRVNTTAFAILGLRASGRSTHDRAIRRAAAFIARNVNNDGGFNFAGRGGPSGIDDTGAALQALAAGGRKRGRIAKRAANFVVRHQDSDGGFALIPGGPSNAQSTAWAVQGLLAVGRDPAKLHRNGARDPLAYLRSLTTASGEVHYSRTSRQTPVWVTGQALAALSRKPFPLKPVNRAHHATAAAAPAATTTPTATPKPVKVQSLPPVASAAPEPAPALEAVAQVPAASALVTALTAH
jgi:Prenyltransferase and squalene oxidase repeat